MEYFIYCDESVSRGKYYSDFYGGALVRSKDYDFVKKTLDEKKVELNLLGEIKWTKVTENYFEKYKEIMTLFFDLVRQDKIKVRIMFRQNAIVPEGLSREQISNGYHLLYYQFVKHAFGLPFREHQEEDVYLRLYFDKLPDTKIQNEVFKSHIYGLQSLVSFRRANIKIRREDITEIDSKDHSIQQCMDIVLGAMAFRLNNMHREKPAGAVRRGKKTIAKEKLYKHILSQIKTIGFPHFNIGISTGGVMSDRWNHSYRHWKFMPREFNEDTSLYKH